MSLKKKFVSARTLFTVCKILVVNKNIQMNLLVDSGNLETVVVYSSALLLLHGKWGVRNC